MNAPDAFAALDAFGRARRPCFFAFDYSLEHAVVRALDEVDPGSLLFELRGRGNAAGLAPLLGRRADGLLPGPGGGFLPSLHDIVPPDFGTYQEAFALAHGAFVAGDSWLLNLTAASRVAFDLPLRELFWMARAPYRLLMDGVLVFSPECFVRIEADRISTFPMKGSLRCARADLPEARRDLLADPKEQAEHVTVVDLLRNDLGRVSDKVGVPRFRYLEEIGLGPDVLVQSSSEIVGELSADWPDRLGGILRELLPAGSVTGAPKASTCRRIDQAEAILGRRRGWYTGVFGVFDGQSLDSAVMIRFIEGVAGDAGGGYSGWFHSGGGLTFDSQALSEYRELVAKVALPAQAGLMETIRVEDGQIRRMDWHARRMATSALAAWNIGAEPAGAAPDWACGLIQDAYLRARDSLGSAADASGGLDLAGRWRLRLEYCPLGLVQAQLTPYAIRRPRRLYIVEAGAIDYACKYADRSGIESLRAGVSGRLAPGQDADWDILMCRDGRLLEASYASLVCAVRGEAGRAGTLATPAFPLLASTRLAACAVENPGAIQAMDLSLDDLPRIERIWLLNAMLDLEDGVEISELYDMAQGEKPIWIRDNSLSGNA